jgi:hypothetical protein
MQWHQLAVASVSQRVLPKLNLLQALRRAVRLRLEIQVRRGGGVLRLLVAPASASASVVEYLKGGGEVAARRGVASVLRNHSACGALARRLSRPLRVAAVRTSAQKLRS